MKRVIRNFFLAVAIFISMIATAEAQNSFAYQAVIRTAQGEVVSNQKVGMRFSLIYNDKTVYSETHTPETNQYGNVQVEVGKGQNATGDFAAVPWSTMQVMMKIEADPNGGTDYIDLGTIQLQPAPYAMYAPVAGTVSTIQAGEPKSDSDALFEVKDKEGNVVFAVYPDGVRVFVDDTSSAKAMQTGFAVAGRRAAKEGGDANIFSVNTEGTQVFVGEEDTSGGKPISTGFAVSGRRAAKDGSADLFTVSSSGTQIYIGEQDGKPISTGFAVAGRRAAKDDDKYLEINADGTRVYIDDADNAGGKAVATGFAVSGRRAAKSDADSKYLEINANGTQVFVDDSDDKPISTGFAVSGRRAAKGNEPKLFEVNQYGTQIYIDTKKGKPISTGFAVSGRRAAKDGSTPKYMVIDADGTRIYVDYEEAKAMQTGFAVSGRRAAKDGTPNTILKVDNVEGTRAYIDDIDGKAMQTGFAVSGRRAAKEGNIFLGINKDKTTLTTKQLEVGSAEAAGNTLVMNSESIKIVTEVFLLTEKENDEPVLTADNTTGVGVNANLMLKGEIGQSVESVAVEEVVPDTILVVDEIKSLQCAELAAALGEADGFALLKIYGANLYTRPQKVDAAGNSFILFDVNGNITSQRENAVAAVVMTQAATPDAQVLIWPLKQTNNTNISFGLTAADGNNQYVNVVAVINSGDGVECKVQALAANNEMGSVTPEGRYIYGEIVKFTAKANDHYHFVSWNDGNCTNPRTMMVTGDTTITALFEPNTYNISLTASEGGSVIGKGTYSYGSEIKLVAKPDSVAGYHFEKWSDDVTDNPRTLTVTSDTTLKAIFAINQYAITFNANGGEFADGATTTENVAHGNSITSFPAVERKDYILTGWTDDNGTSFTKENIVNGEVTLYAQWLQTTYYVADADHDGSADGDGTSGNPYASINDALEQIISVGKDTAAYTICVKGVLAEDGMLIPEALDGKISKLTIEGDGGQMETDKGGEGTHYVPGGTLTKASEFGRVLGVATSVPVTLRNITVTGGKLDIYHSTTMDDYNGGGIFVDGIADVTIADSAYIVGNEASGDHEGRGSGVFVLGKLTMTGGEISNNGYTITGGGVFVAGEFTMTGGTISGNSAGDGGGVFVVGKFTMTGGTISNNDDSFGGGAVYVCGDGSFLMGGSAYIPASNNVKLDNTHITIISDLKAQAPVATIKIGKNNSNNTTAEDYNTKVLHANPEGNNVEEDETLLKNNYTKFAILPRYYYDYGTLNGFYYDYRILETGYLQHFCSLILYENEDETTPYGEPQTLVDGDMLEKSPEHRDKEGYQFLGWHRRKWNGWDGFNTEVDSLVFPYEVTAEDDTIILVGQWARNTFYVKNGGNDNKGGTNSGDDALATIAGAVSKMNNSQVDYTIVVSGTLVDQQAIADIMIVNPDVPGGDALTPIPARSITLCGETGNETDAIDFGWYLDMGGLEPYMQNRHEIAEQGSALTINTMVPVTIENLTITGGYAFGSDGGGVYIGSYANVTIADGALIKENWNSRDLDNENGGNGGGVYVSPYANLSLTSEGLISENAAVNGGGVYVDENATFNKDGGLITRNIASNGGGVCVANGATLTMTNGQIAQNTAYEDGGGIFTEGTFTMTGGTIGGSEDDANTAKNGGGILCYSATIGGNSTENRPEISYNTASNNGGGVAAVEANSGTINITNAIISYNTANKGGGLYQGQWTKMFIGDGTLVTGNKASDGSGFSFGNSAAYNLVMTGGVINGCANISSQAIKMSGNAKVDTVRLESRTYVGIAGKLDSDKVAVIVPSEYHNGVQLIRKENDDVTDEVFTAAISKFTVAPKKLDENTTLNCYITNDGNLLMDVNIGEVVNRITSATKFGNISVEGMMPNDGISRIGDALRNKTDQSVPIALDLSGVSGMQTIPGSVNGEPTNFARCLNLVSITLPEGITSIGEYAFHGCTSLASVSIPEGVTSIGSRAFEGCDLSEGFALPEGITTIESLCFNSCKFKNIIIPDGVKTIGLMVFHSCPNLESIVLPASVTQIGNQAFGYCENLSTVYFKGSQADRNGISVEDENEPLVEAEWVYNYSPLYVSPGAEGASDENSGLSASEPLATLSGAISKMNNNSNNYYVFITGELTGAQTISGEISAQSITLVGARGMSSEGYPQDGLYGNQEGTTLLVETNKPVTVKDLRITGGSNRGLWIYSDAKVTLDHAYISGNTNPDGNYFGAGVYNQGSLTVLSGTKIIYNTINHGDNDSWGGSGIYVHTSARSTRIVGGTITGNGDKGIYCDKREISIGGDAIVDDIYMANTNNADPYTILICSTLENYSADNQITVDLKNYGDIIIDKQLITCSPIGDFNFADEVKKFKLVDNHYYIDEEGKIQKYPTGAITGKFSVSGSKQVWFSQGNLQYQASTQTWRFATNQYDYVGDDSDGNVYVGTQKSNNASISATYAGWIDLFGWGTGSNPTLCVYGDSYESFSEWGSNIISNGGNENDQEMWRTLTKTEWDYLFNHRSTEYRYTKAKVNGVCGIVLLPDNWNTNTYSFGKYNDPAADFNTVATGNWNKIEASGAVFLPLAGTRGFDSQTTSPDILFPNSWGEYWSKTGYDSNAVSKEAYCFMYSNDDLQFITGQRCKGKSVRLVQEVK
ncbi:MAG: leucine-rich repeat protein [Salinivirgaceae bacterium]|nr:leucine-rich repeat protein [Salinivirgaceae bacterium]